MGYKRKRSTTTTRRRVRRRTNRPSRGLGMAKFDLTRKVYAGNWAFSSAATAGFWRYFQFQPSTQFANWSQYSDVFDEYKIHSVKYEFRPSLTAYVGPSPSTGVYTYGLGNMHLINDPSSTTLPSGLYSISNLNTFFEQAQRVKTVSANRVATMTFKPKVQDQVLGGGLAARSTPASWLKTDSSGVEHRGIHVFLETFNNAGADNNLAYDIFITVRMSFRGCR